MGDLCDCGICELIDKENLYYATLQELVEECGMSLNEAKNGYKLVDEVVKVATSRIGSMREVVRNVISPGFDYLPADSKRCANFVKYLADVYTYNRQQAEKKAVPKHKCNHVYPSGSDAIEYSSTYEMRSSDMKCNICKKHGTREELEADRSEYLRGICTKLKEYKICFARCDREHLCAKVMNYIHKNEGGVIDEKV